MKTFVISLPQLKRTLAVEAGKNLFYALRETGDIPIAGTCDAEGVCGKCCVELSGEKITPEGRRETRVKKENGLPLNQRLLCLQKAQCDLMIRTSYW